MVSDDALSVLQCLAVALVWGTTNAFLQRGEDVDSFNNNLKVTAFKLFRC